MTTIQERISINPEIRFGNPYCGSGYSGLARQRYEYGRDCRGFSIGNKGEYFGSFGVCGQSGGKYRAHTDLKYVVPNKYTKTWKLLIIAIPLK